MLEVLFPRGASIRKLSAARESVDPNLQNRTGPGALDCTILVVQCELVPPFGPPSPAPKPSQLVIKLSPWEIADFISIC